MHRFIFFSFLHVIFILGAGLWASPLLSYWRHVGEVFWAFLVVLIRAFGFNLPISWIAVVNFVVLLSVTVNR